MFKINEDTMLFCNTRTPEGELLKWCPNCNLRYGFKASHVFRDFSIYSSLWQHLRRDGWVTFKCRKATEDFVLAAAYIKHIKNNI